MRLTKGTVIGPYEIVDPIGAGGMGEVYRARDAKLGRDVAIKTLPEVFARDPERLARFVREAQALAALNHPNIATLHELREVNESTYLILELVEGETLAERIRRGPLPLEDVIDIARQIAEALEAAHERGVVHRDLKPANVKITPQGRVKVLDFGLAKMLQAGGMPSGTHSFSNSPTMLSGSMPGVILGTAAYMSPEQARGKEVDRRGDMWAFGCILYEMLTGRQTFPNEEDLSDTLAGILKGEPDWKALPAETPPSIRKVLERCLRKDARRRLRDAADARIEIDDAATETATPIAVIQAQPPSRRREFVFAALALAFLLAAAALAFHVYRTPSAEQRTARFEVMLPPGVTPVNEMGQFLSPDGRVLAVLANSTGKTQIWVRRLNASTAQPLAGSEGAGGRPFWSPDSQYLGFMDGQGKLRKISISGGPSQIIANQGGRDFAWSPDGVILIGGNAGPLRRVSSAGGALTAETELDGAAKETTHDYPTFLPDGRHYLYLVRSGTAQIQNGVGIVYVGLLGSKERHKLTGITSGARYSPTGHVLFMNGGTLMAQRFDPDRLALSGDPFPVAENVRAGVTAEFSASLNGSLALLGSDSSFQRELAWYDRSGKQVGLAAPADEYWYPQLSPNGKSIVFFRGSPSDVWTLDLEKRLTTPLTRDPATDRDAIWAPDGRTVVYTSNRAGGTREFYQRAIGVVGEDKLILKTSEIKIPSDWSRDGRYIVYNAGGDIWMLPLDKKEPVRFTQAPAIEEAAQISPDGRWIVYQSNESGQFEISVESFPQRGIRQQISATGGISPRWSRDGKELIYRTLGNPFMVMAVSIRPAGASLAFGTPSSLFTISAASADFAGISPDGRFLWARTVESSAPASITVILNWAAELKK